MNFNRCKKIPKVFYTTADMLSELTPKGKIMVQQNKELNITKFTDRFDFSVTTNHMAILNAVILDTPEANFAKIQLIKEELSAGRYVINANNIAAKLLAFAPVIEEVEMA